MIAVDGPAASGKGTLASRLAAHLGFHHLDTGLLYRAVAAHTPGEGEAAAVATAAAFDAGWLADPRLRDEATGRAASRISVHPGVRAALLDFQRRFAARAPGAVLDGRDIGTVVCPTADAKLFVTASVEIRAARRLRELRARRSPSIFSAVLQDLMERDRRDSRRASAPMVAASDALILDTSFLDATEVFAAALAHIQLQIV